MVRELLSLSTEERAEFLKDCTPEERAAIQREMWRADPVVFAEDVFGLRVWSRQAEVLRAPLLYEDVAVAAGRKVSKTLNIALLAYWWMYARGEPDSHVIIMSASGRQVLHFIWPEVVKLYGMALKRGHRLCEEPAKLPDTGVKFANGDIIGFSTDDREKAQGASGVNVIYLLDEASGIEAPILEAVDGNLAGGGQRVMFANPTQVVGGFYDAFHSDRADWHCITISSEESPNITGECPPIPGLATRKWVEKRERKRGRNSIWFRVHVLGLFPGGGINTVVPEGMVTTATARWLPRQPDGSAPDEHALWAEAEGPLVIGVDVARFGDDDSVISPVRSKRAARQIAIHGLDVVEVGQHALKAARASRRNHERVTIRVDVGGLGAGVADNLRHSGVDWIDVVDCNSSSHSNDDQYHRLRDELWFGIPDWLQAGGCFAADPALEEELVSVKYGFARDSGKMQVESKDKLKERIERSPDRADALALAVWGGGSAEPAATFERSHAGRHIVGDWGPGRDVLRDNRTTFVKRPEDRDRTPRSGINGGW